MPVINHSVHESTRKKIDEPYGCCNRKHKTSYVVRIRRYKSDGTYTMVFERVRNAMSRECRHDNSLNDPGCATCKHRGSGEKYAEQVREGGSC